MARLWCSLSRQRSCATSRSSTTARNPDPLLAARVDAVCDLEADAFVGVRVSKYKERFGFGFLNEDKYAGELAGVAERVEQGGRAAASRPGEGATCASWLGERGRCRLFTCWIP